MCAEFELVGRPSMEVLRKKALKAHSVISGGRALRVRLFTLLDSPEESNDSPESKLLVHVEPFPCPEHWHYPIVSFEANNTPPRTRGHPKGAALLMIVADAVSLKAT